MRVMRYLSLIVGLFVVGGCATQQPPPAVSLSWFETVESIRHDARIRDPALVLDVIVIYPEEGYLADSNILNTTITLVNPATAAVFRATFLPGEIASPVPDARTAALVNPDADALFRLVRITPHAALLTANTQLAAYRATYPQDIGFVIVLDSDNGVSATVRRTTTVDWHIRYAARGTQTAFSVWIDAQTGTVLQTRFEDFNRKRRQDF